MLMFTVTAVAQSRPPIEVDERFFSNGDPSLKSHYYRTDIGRIVLHGSYMEWEESSSHKLKFDGTYFDGVLEGTCMQASYYAEYFGFQMASRRDSIYENGFEISATLTEYYTDGVITTVTPFRYGSKSGTEKIWYDGYLKTATDYVNGRKHGKEYQYYQSSDVVNFDLQNADGLRHGEWLRYSTNGLLTCRTFYIRGRQHGSYDLWDSRTGHIAYGKYSNGFIYGLWREYSYIDEKWHDYDYGPAIPLEDIVDDERTVSGIVIDRIYGIPLQYVSVSVGSESAVSSSDGKFSMKITSDTIENISCSGIGFYDLSDQIMMADRDAVNLTISMLRKFKKPTLSKVKSQYPSSSVFLAGIPVENRYSAVIDWQTSPPGEAVFSVNGTKNTVHPTGPETNLVEKTYMVTAAPFSAAAIPGVNKVVLQAENPSHQKSVPEYFQVNLVPMPAWAAFLGGFTRGPVTAEAVLSYQIKAAYPAEPMKIRIDEKTLGSTLWTAWSLIPVVGGRTLGLPPTQAFIDVEAKSDGSGSVTAGGLSGFEAAGQKLEAKIGGKGNVAYTPGQGFCWNGGSILFALDGTITKEVGPITVIPALEGAVSLPLLGRPISWFNERAKILASVYAGYSMDLQVLDDDGSLGLTGASGDIKTGLNLGLSMQISKLKASVYGGGETVLSWHVPADPQYLDKVVSKVYAKAVFNVWTFEQTYNAEYDFT